MKREEILELFPDATDEQISKLLNKHHAEISAKQRADSEAAEKAAKSDELAQTVTTLQAQLEKVTADLGNARRESNLANAVAALTKAGMDETFARAVAAGAVSDDAKASTTNVTALVNAYTAMEQARANTLAEQGLRNMPQPQQNSGTAPDASVEYAKKLAEGKAIHSTSGTLEAFAK